MTAKSNMQIAEQFGLDPLLLPPPDGLIAPEKPTAAQMRKQRDAAVAALQAIYDRLTHVDYKAAYPSADWPPHVIGTCKSMAFIGLRRSGACTDVAAEIRQSAKEAAHLAQMAH